jgi:hypothetical protein
MNCNGFGRKPPSHNRATILNLFGITEEIHKRTLGSLVSQPRGGFRFSFTRKMLLKVFMFAPCINSDENSFIVPTDALNNIKP